MRFNGGQLTEPTELPNRDTFHILPTGIKCESSVRSLIGNGVSLDPTILLRDFETMNKNGIELNQKKLVISDRANLVTSFHDEVACKLGEASSDFKRVQGFDVTHAFKPIKLALRVT